MLGRSTGAVLIGVDARLVEVEVDLGGGLPTIAAVGLPDIAVREGIDRIRAALPHAGFRLPQRRVTINLAPAEIRKHGSGLDLPIALALLLADGQIPTVSTRDAIVTGELGLDGTVRAVRGVLSIALEARRCGRRRLLVPTANADEAALVGGLHVIPLSTLADATAAVHGALPARLPVDAEALLRAGQVSGGEPDLTDVKGQPSARRGLEIAAAGGHHLLLSGPPGSGKSMLARRLPGILPPLDVEEALEVTRVWSAGGTARGLVTRRPFRAPHHAISLAGMTGGGPRMRPGELSLATRGVLYLDELTEFRRDVLEALRQPLEDGRISIVRVHATAEFPAAFTLVASMNPCPCGYWGTPGGRCSCSPLQVRRYRGKLSGPLLDRFDLVVEVPALEPRALARAPDGESSPRVRVRVVRARTRQQARFGRSAAACNAAMTPRELAAHAQPGPDGTRLLVAAAQRLGLSARGFDRVRRVARTLADLEEAAERIGATHVAEALQYRPPRVEPAG